MKILQVHNFYQYSGGEDVVVKNEYELLTAKGHEVIQYLRNNSEINNYSLFQKSKLLFDTTFSKKTYRELSHILKTGKPNICHVHNILPLISPSVYIACKDYCVPVVQTLHNYRLLCSNAYLFRDGKICEECIGKGLYHSLKYGCYRNSRIQTYALARMVEKNKVKRRWDEGIDAYIALTEFSKNKFIKGRLPKDKIYVKPNFLSEDPGISDSQGNYFFFAGRLDITKGVKTLLVAHNKIDSKIEIKIAGDGVLKNEILSQSKINYLGQLPHQKLIETLKGAISLIFPSVLYETFGLLIIEAFACGKPVIASNLGAMAEIIEDGKTGLLFEPGNSEDLAQKINWAYSHKEEMKKMGLNARREFEEKYTADKNYDMLMQIYNNL